MFVTSLLLIVFSIMSSFIMMYISLATSIGPWIGPVLVLLIAPVLRLVWGEVDLEKHVQLVIGSSIGGILATACAFSFPALFFIDVNLYEQYQSNLLFFVGGLAGISACAGLYGFLIAYIMDEEFAEIRTAQFPSGQLIFSMLNALDQVAQRIRLVAGAVSYGGFLAVRWAVLKFVYISGIHVYANSSSLVIMPMLCAIGFTTGHVMIVPLLVGVGVKYVFVIGLAQKILQIGQFDFSLALCSGIMLVGIGISSVKMVCNVYALGRQGGKIDLKSFFKRLWSVIYRYNVLYLLLAWVMFSRYMGISLVLSLYVLIATIYATYLMVILASQTGLAYLGRFATFVMIPAMFMFNCSPIELIMIAVFVEVAGGVAVDVASGYKIIAMSGFDKKKFISTQIVGVFVAGCASAFALYILSSYLVLGSPLLAAYKAHARALLINFQSFNLYGIMSGLVVGFACHWLRINTATIIGGILMPLETSFGLIFGGMLAQLTAWKSWWYPFCAGVFAATSLYMIGDACGLFNWLIHVSTAVFSL